MVFEGRHGVSDRERRFPQPIGVDVALHVDLAAAGSADDLEQTVDYTIVYARVREVVESRTFRLLEAIAQTLARELLDACPAATAIDVTVRKPRVQLGGPIDSSGVEIHRRRPGGGVSESSGG
jgi:dihydroneopterin aldolase